MNDKNFTVLPFPRSRQVVVDAGRLGARRPIIYALLEFDVTDARAIIRRHKEEFGESLSFTAFIIACLGRAVAADPSVQAYRNWRNQLIVYNDVDIVTMIEPEQGAVAIPHIIRQTNRKSYRQIHDEIRSIQATPAASEQQGKLARIGQYSPRFVRNIFYWLIRQNPHWFVRNAGTVTVTAVGMFGQGSGWGLGFLPMHTLGIIIGGIGEKPALVDGQLVAREVLHVTISADHDIVDGAPVARFAQRLRNLVEAADGLREIAGTQLL